MLTTVGTTQYQRDAMKKQGAVGVVVDCCASIGAKPFNWQVFIVNKKGQTIMQIQHIFESKEEAERVGMETARERYGTAIALA